MKMCIVLFWLVLVGVCLVWILLVGVQMVNDLIIGNLKVMVFGNVVIVDEIGIDLVYYNLVVLIRMKGCQVIVKLFIGVMDICVGFKVLLNYGEGIFGLCDDLVVNSYSWILILIMYLFGFGGMIDVLLLVVLLVGILINLLGFKFIFVINVYIL